MCWDNSFTDDSELLKAVVSDFYDNLVKAQVSAHTLSFDTEDVDETIHDIVQSVVDKIDSAQSEIYLLLQHLDSANDREHVYA